MKLLAAAVLALAFASSAGAATWTTVSKGTLTNIVKPALLHTQKGSDLVVYGNGQAQTIELSRNGSAPRVLVTGDQAAGNAQLVQQPDGTIQLFFPGNERTERLTSTDDGQTWTGPVVTQTNYISPIEGAAVRPDGTPVFSVDNTFGVYVFQGLNGEAVQNVFPHCCGYAESLAVDSTGLLQIVLWSNANPPLANYVYETLGPDLTPSAPLVYSTSAETLSNDNRVPLVADNAGNTFAGRMEGSPESTGFWVDRFRGGKRVGMVRLWGKFHDQSNRMALAVEPDGKLWAFWTADGAVRAARSRSAGAHFGAQVNVPLPSAATPYQLEALARPGSATAYVNTGSAVIASPNILPGLAVSLKKAGKTWTATVVDDGFGVAGATLAGGGHTLHTNGSGKASLAGLPHHLLLKVTKSGYASAGFRVP